MIRSLILAPVIAVAAAAPLASGCNANPTESCVTGPCSLGTGGATATGSATTTTGTGGSAGDAGSDGGPNAASCPQVPQTGDFPCDVFEVVHRVCNPCHQMPPL